MIFENPVRFAARVAAREVVRNGAILREVATGRIVGHVQETAGLARLVSGGGLNPAQLVTQGIQIVQNEQIKAGLALVQNLQLANLALTGIGIGVSVAGFAVLWKKIDRVEGEIGKLRAEIEALRHGIEEDRHKDWVKLFSRLESLCGQVNGAWDARDPRAEWLPAAHALNELSVFFLNWSNELGETTDPVRSALRARLIHAYIVAMGTNVAARLAAEDSLLAEKAAATLSRELNRLTGSTGAATLLRERLAGEDVAALSNADRVDAIERLRPEVEQAARLLREREDAAASAPLTIAALRDAGLSGREWLERARAETEAPLICLAAA